MNVRFQKILSIAGVVLLAALGAAAQTTTASVTGAVLDQSGAAVAKASVTMENLQTHLQATVQSNSAGFYRVAGLLAGAYRAKVVKSGFQSVVQDNIDLHGQDEVALNYTLKVGSVSETVTVTGAEPLLQSESSTVSTVIDEIGRAHV